jgi:DNA-binding GntR family transcriptional regulator
MPLNAEERAYRSIIQLILSGHYRPGDFLLELEIAPELEMSRTPVSRALSRLVTEGFLNKIPKKGCYIPLPTPEDAEQVFFARKAVESQAAAGAALHAREEEIRHLQEVVLEDQEAVQMRHREIFSRINEDFHLGIAKASHNVYLEKWIRNIFWRSNLYVFYFDSFYKSEEVDIPQKTPMQHAAIIKAITERDPDLAARLMNEHIHRTYEVLLFGR